MIFAMMEGNCDISVQRQKNRRGISRPKDISVTSRKMKKYYRFLHNEIRKFEGKTEEKTA